MTELNKEYIIWNLSEALEELSRTINELKSNPDYGRPEYSVAMTHLYHHINNAWNASAVAKERTDEYSEQDFNDWRQFPADVLL